MEKRQPLFFFMAIEYKMDCANRPQGNQDGMIRTGDGQFLIKEQGVTETIKERLENPVFQEETAKAGSTDFPFPGFIRERTVRSGYTLLSSDILYVPGPS